MCAHTKERDVQKTNNNKIKENNIHFRAYCHRVKLILTLRADFKNKEFS